MPKIAVLLSGGVDSSVTLQLLKDQGYDITAFYLKIWLPREMSFLGECPWKKDITFAKKVCNQLNIPLEIVEMQEPYWETVVSYTINEVKEGRTPSPDIFCNKYVKFGAFFKYIGDKFDKIATGHYAQVEKKDNFYILKKGIDPIKDQSYFLSRIDQEQLSKLIFPIGHFTKNEIRKLANKYKLPTAERKDSQGICFLGKISFRDFIKHYVGIKKGNLVEYESEKIVGTHDGFWFYTIGQRKGIGLSGGPWYVVKKDPDNNIVYISKKYSDIKTIRSTFKVEDFHWIGRKITANRELELKVRHGKEIIKGKMYFSENKKEATINLHKKDQGLAPGQFAVFYDGDECLGSARIK